MTQLVTKVQVKDLARESIHVYVLRIREGCESLPGFLGMVSDEEMNRAKRFLSERDSVHYLAAHSTLRSLICAYTGIHSLELKFSYSRDGKPSMRNAGAEEVHFSLSHTDCFIAIAFGIKREVGIDIEWCRPIANIDQLVSRHFTQNEYEEYCEYGSEDQMRSFFCGWTRKEAFLKAVGLGLTHGLSFFTVPMKPNRTFSKVEYDDGSGSRIWTVQDIFTNSEEAVASLAYEGDGAVITTFLGEVLVAGNNLEIYFNASMNESWPDNMREVLQ